MYITLLAHALTEFKIQLRTYVMLIDTTMLR